jgi:hypothetical protein
MGIIEMEPRKAQLGVLTVDKENKVGIAIKNLGDAGLTIYRIVSSKSKTVYFDSKKAEEITIPAGGQRTIKFIIKPVEPGRFLDTILIYSDARNDIGKGYKGLLAGEVR